MLTEKQREYLKNAHHRWNIKVGAVRSGKTYADFFQLPRRIRACTGAGQIFLIGATVDTLARNILDPMRNIWGADMVGNPSPGGSVHLFGRKCTLIGGSSAGQAAKLQGASAEYAYGDEITTWNEEVFRMLQSRLDRPNSCFDGTCNPSHPGHWFKKFLDSTPDLYCQTYTLDDNPTLPAAFREALKQEYAGTSYYSRFILGQWTAAEGCIYQQFNENPQKFLFDSTEIAQLKGGEIHIGVDFGGSRSATAFSAIWHGPYRGTDAVISLAAQRHPGELDPDRLAQLLLRFAEQILPLTAFRTGNLLAPINCDSAEPILIRGIRRHFAENAADPAQFSIRPALKTPIRARIFRTLRLMAAGRYFMTAQCAPLRDAFSRAMWKPGGEDLRLDDFTTDIDSLDAFEYALERVKDS